MIEITDLQCVRNEQALFEKVSFVLNRGEILQVLGANGIGKSTMLRTIAQQQQPGTFCYISHKHNLHPALTVCDNLIFLQALLPDSTDEENSKLRFALAYFDLQHCADKPSHELSAGQLQRVSLARLCLTKAKLWILDEPTANLDAVAQQLLINICEQHLINQGMIICATHNILQFPPTSSKTIRLQKYA